MDRIEVATMVITVARQCADGYRRAITQFDTPEQKDVSEKCAIAASNTGWFILVSMGFKPSEIMQLRAAADSSSAHGEQK